MKIISFDKELSSKRVFGFDLIRFSAILFVLISHSVRLISSNLIFDKRFAILGYFGVELFFVLSGFLIGLILIKIYEKNQKLNYKILTSFWKRRWFRTLPNYYLMLIIFFIYFLIFETNYNFNWKFISYIFFSQNIVTYHPPFMGIAWSLSIEEWFYLLFPGTLLITDVLFKEKYTIKHKIFIGILILIILPLILRIILCIVFSGDWYYDFRKIVPLRLDAIGFGVLAAFFFFYYPKIFIKYKNNLMLIGIVITSLSTAVFFMKDNSFISFFTKTFYFSFTNIGFALFIPFAYSMQIKNKIIVKYVTIISIISYSLYLTHSLIIKILENYISASNKITLFVLFWFFSFIVSVILYKIYEKPFTDLRDKI